MKSYLVGGAVRDELLGRPVTEKDYVVVGATEESMLAQGFTRVGKDFPVFLHPKTKDEYALARTERKSGKGYRGFVFTADPSVTLEEDLIRRDLTINSMAKTETGEIIDPYGGLRDIANRSLRHTSEAFKEDPVRILRIARFAARYAYLGFGIHGDTVNLMRELVSSGEVAHLVPERIWKEFSRALTEKNPEVYFDVLHTCGALREIMPELVEDINSSQEIKEAAFYPLFLSACQKSEQALIRFSHLIFPLRQNNQSLRDTKNIEPPRIKSLCDRICAPREYRDMARLLATYQSFYQKIYSLSANEILLLINKTDALRNLARFHTFLEACELFDDQQQDKSHFLLSCATAVKNVATKPLLQAGFSGVDFGQELDKLRIHEIEKLTPLNK